MILAQGGSSLNVNAVDHNNRTALWKACAKGHAAVARCVVSVCFPSPIYVHNTWGFTLCVERCTTKLLPNHCTNRTRRALILDGGADSTIKSRSGTTALDIARSSGHKGCVELLEVSCSRNLRATITWRYGDKIEQRTVFFCIPAPER